MEKIEKENLNLDENTGIKRILCNDPELSIFTKEKPTLNWIRFYNILLILIVLITALIPFIKNP